MRAFPLLLVLLAVAALAVSPGEPRFTYREYGYIIVEGGWVIEVKAGFWEPWIPGSKAEVQVELLAREAAPQSRASIVSVTVSTGSVNSSYYAGLLLGAGDRRALTMQLELSEPKYSSLKPGDSILEFFTLTVKGYIEGPEGRTFFSRSFTIPVIVAIPSGMIKVSVEGQRVVRLGEEAGLSVVLQNRGSSQVYHLEVMVYVNGSAVETAYYPLLDPGSTRVLTVKFKPVEPGAYMVAVHVRYLSPGYGALNAAYATIVYVKASYIITLSQPVATGEGFKLVGYISPQPLAETPVYIESSIDGVTWSPVEALTPTREGLFVTSVKLGREGFLLVRARVPETGKTLESISNVVVLANTTIPQLQRAAETVTVAKTETRTVPHTVTVTVAPPSPQTPLAQETLTPGVPAQLAALAVVAVGALIGLALLLIFRRK